MSGTAGLGAAAAESSIPDTARADVPQQRDPMTSARSALLCGVGVIVAFACASIFAILLPPLLFRDLGLAPIITANTTLFVYALTEEASKAIGVVIARPGANRFSWLWLTTTLGAGFGVIERVLLTLASSTPPSPLQLAFDTRAILGHVALTTLCVAIARLTGRNLPGWVLGVVAAAVLHALTNLTPRLVTGSAGYAAHAIAALAFVIIIGAATIWRERLDWRRPSAKAV